MPVMKQSACQRSRSTEAVLPEPNPNPLGAADRGEYRESAGDVRSKRLFEWLIGPGCWRSFGRAGRRFQYSSCPLAAPGILYKRASRVRHRTIGILRYRGLLYPPFRKEHARDRVPLLAWPRWAGVGPAFRPAPAHGAVWRIPARKIDTPSQPVVFQA